MTEPTPQDQQQQGQEPPQPQQQTPPWGEDFDPARAWDKLQKANREAEGLRARLKEAEPRLSEYDRLVEAGKSEQQRLEEQAAANERRAETAEAEALRVRVALMHGVPADYLDLIGSGTEEQVTANAQRVATLLAAQQAVQPTPPPVPNSAALQPGATPSPPPQGTDEYLWDQVAHRFDPKKY